FKSTKNFENEVQERIKTGSRPIVICEGDTDPRYLKAAAKLLGFADIEANVDFEWIGLKDSAGNTKGGGSANIDSAIRFLRSNPQFITRSILMLYDCDKPHPSEDFGDLHVRSIERRVENVNTDAGIENLLPNECFEDHFYSVKETKSGTKKTTIRDLRKEALCDHLC
ncbi:hypothetical protein I3A86_26660, partial [Salmonella enterica]|nr:hypothetical protein [Salmonella enterica]